MKRQKNNSLLGSKFGVYLHLLIILPLIPIETNAQGWTFNFQLAYSGNCAGAGNIVLPNFPQNTFQTQAQCESLRQQILAITASGGGCTVYYKCTPCTGSDIVNPSESNPGDVSFNLNNGKPFFVPHQSKAFEEWSKNYKDQLASYGITSILGQSITPNSNLPMSGNQKINKQYSEDAEKFKPKGAAKKVVKKEDNNFSDKTVPIMGGTLLTPEELERQRLIKQFGPNYIDHMRMFSTIQNGEIDKSAHPIIEDYRYIGVKAAGWLDPPASYVGIVAVDFAAADASAVMDYKDGKPLPSGLFGLVNKAGDQVAKDIDPKLPEDILGNYTDKTIESVAGEGFAKHVGIATKAIGIAQDLTEENGIIDRSKRILRYHTEQISNYRNKPDGN